MFRILDSAGCTGWHKGKSKIFLKSEHVTALNAVLDRAHAAEASRLAAADKQKREQQARDQLQQEHDAQHELPRDPHGANRTLFVSASFWTRVVVLVAVGW
jgi:hypothetical protein